jgi:hypothetical protein
MRGFKMMQPHPQRCETCDKYKFNGGCIALAKDTSLIRIVGCASHSHQQFEQDKMFKAFVSLITSEIVYDDGDMYYKVNPDKYVNLLAEFNNINGDECI